VQRLGCRFADLRAERQADVSADRHFEAGRFKDPPGESRRGRFAFRPRDRDHPTLQPSRRELDFPDDRNPLRFGAGNHRLLGRYTGAENDEVRGLECLRLVAAELELDTKLPQRVGPIEVGADVRHRDMRAAAGQQFGGRDAAAGRARDGHALVPDVERHSRHRSFNVANENRPKMIATITNRVITFGSLQPINSK